MCNGCFTGNAFYLFIKYCLLCILLYMYKMYSFSSKRFLFPISFFKCPAPPTYATTLGLADNRFNFNKWVTAYFTDSTVGLLSTASQHTLLLSNQSKGTLEHLDMNAIACYLRNTTLTEIVWTLKHWVKKF